MIQNTNSPNMNEQFVYARVRKGAPMPHALTSFMTEESFMAFRNECESAHTTSDFHAVVARFNAGYSEPAVRGHEELNSGAALLWESIWTLGGFLGATKTGCDRTLIFDTYVLVRGRTAVAPVAPGGSVPIAYANASSVPVLTTAAPASSYSNGVPVANPVN